LASLPKIRRNDGGPSVPTVAQSLGIHHHWPVVPARCNNDLPGQGGAEDGFGVVREDADIRSSHAVAKPVQQLLLECRRYRSRVLSINSNDLLILRDDAGL